MNGALDLLRLGQFEVMLKFFAGPAPGYLGQGAAAVPLPV
jgi:hypothetical protein